MDFVVNAALGMVLAAVGVFLAVAASVERARQAVVARAGEAYEEYKKGPSDSDAVEEALGKALAADSESADAGFMLGRVLILKGDVKGAESAMEASLRANPFNGAAHYWFARVLSEQGATGPAAAEMKLAAVLAGNQPDYMYRIGYYFFTRWKKTGDLVDLEDSLRFFRKSSELDLERLYRIFDILREFAIHYDTLANVIPDSDDAHFKAARYFGFSMGMWLFSLKEMEKARGMYGRNPEFPYVYGLALLHNGRVSDSRKHLLEGIDALGGSEKHILELEIHYRAAQQPAEAAAVYRELAALYPQSPAPSVNLGKHLLAEAHRKYAEESAAIDKERDEALASSQPEKREWIRQTAETRKKNAFTDRFDAVRVFFREACRKTPDTTLCYLLADLENNLSNPSQAEHWIRRAIEIDSSWIGGWYWYISLLIRQERFDDALARTAEALERFPGDQRLRQLKDSTLDMKIRSSKKE